jgi:hypothetical protein
MKKLLCSLILLSFLNIGCALKPHLQIKVSGTRFNNLTLTKPKNLSICVVAGKKNVDPFLGDEVREKMQKLLLSKDYKVTCDRPDFYCAFSYGISSSSMASRAIPVSGCYLILELHYAIDFEQSFNSEPVWIGEITCFGAGPDLTAVMDYMLVAASKRFTKNTKKPVTLLMSLNDRRVKKLNREQ